MNYTSTMQFIELFCQHRALWDRNDVNYLNKTERMRQREAIGYAMGMTEVDVGKKICNLRTYYLREMVKRDKAVVCGQESADSYVPKWPYFDALDTFLQDVVRKKRNEYLTAGGSFPELSYVYAADDHFSDNDIPDDFPNDSNDLSRDSHSGGGGGAGEGRKLSHSATNDLATCSNDDDSDPSPKQPKLEPVDDLATVSVDGEDGCVHGKESRCLGLESSGSGLGTGVPFPRSPFRVQPSLLSTSMGAQPSSSSHRLAAMRGPVPVQGITSSANGGLGVESLRMNGHNMSCGIMAGAQGGLPGNIPSGMVLVEEDEDWLFGRYIVAELKKVKSFKDKQLAKMRIQQIVTYAQLGMGEQGTSAGVDV